MMKATEQSKSIRSYYVRGMDCAEETQVLREELGGLLGTEERLGFDILKRKMTVDLTGLDVAEEEILRATERAGLRAEPWSKAQARTQPSTFSQRQARSILCAASGVLLSAGFAAQAMHDGGMLRALLLGQAGGHGLPLPAVLLYLASIANGAWYVLPGALRAARALRPDMNLLMTVAVAGAAGIGEWFEAATVSFLFALALLLESWSVARARHAIEALLDLSPETARFRLPGADEVTEADVSRVPVGATVLVRPGERIPLDGRVAQGETTVNQSPITGESMPVPKRQGDEVYAGTINGEGAIELRTIRPAAESALARIIQLVEEAHSRRAPSQRWVERFARVYTPAVLVLAAGTALIAPVALGGSWAHWFYRALVMLVIACPCALVISTPVSIVSGLTAAARAGVLVKGGAYLETPANLMGIAFDKTGTLTEGRPRVQKVVPFGSHTSKQILEKAAALEAESGHPLARAILEAARASSARIDAAKNLTTIPGRGMTGLIEGRRHWIGSHRLMEEYAVEADESHRVALELEDAGFTVVALGNEKHTCGLIGVADEVRSNARATLAELRREGITRIIMLTGDNLRTALAVGREVGIDEVRAELLPEEKVSAMGELSSKLERVAMVGDGVNDAPAMAAATLGIAMGAVGSDAAIEAADIALMSDDLSRVPWLIRHAKRTLNVIRQNITLSLAIKGLFMLLAILGLATLWMAIAADMGASLLVIANSLRLLR